MNTLSEYIRKKTLPSKTIDDYRNAAVALIEAEGGGFGAPKSFMVEFAFDCKHALNQKVRQLAIANQIPSDSDATMNTTQKTALLQSMQQVLTLYENKAKIYDQQASSVKLFEYEKKDKENKKDKDGKVRNLSSGGQCTITITKEAWKKIEQDQANPEQIKGILAQEPIQILPSGKIQGVRCIKPEQYGWVFSTSSSNRLVDTTTSTGNFPPTALTFDTYKTNVGH